MSEYDELVQRTISTINEARSSEQQRRSKVDRAWDPLMNEHRNNLARLANALNVELKRIGFEITSVSSNGEAGTSAKLTASIHRVGNQLFEPQAKQLPNFTVKITREGNYELQSSASPDGKAQTFDAGSAEVAEQLENAFAAHVAAAVTAEIKQ